MNGNDGPKLSPKATAARCGVTTKTLSIWRAKPGRGPEPWFRVSSRRVVYCAAGVDAWLQARRMTPQTVEQEDDDAPFGVAPLSFDSDD